MAWQDDLEGIGAPSPAPQPATGKTDFTSDLDAISAVPAALAPKAAAAPSAAAAPATAVPSPLEQASPSGFASNVMADYPEVLEGTAHAFLHPIHTAENLADIGMGFLEKLGIKTGDEHIPAANQIGQYVVDNYGGWDNLKRSAYEHPVRTAMDLSAFVGGGGALLRGAGMASAADVAGTAARLANPLAPIGAVARGAGKLGAEVAGGLTHAGAEPFKYAAEAGYQGGSAAKAFRAAQTGRMPLEEPVEDARAALRARETRRSDEYNTKMAALGRNPTTMNLTDIQQALTGELAKRTYQGQPISVTPMPVDAVLSKIGDEVAGWQQRGPQALTPGGIDVLKRNIGDIAKGLQRGTPESTAAWNIYHAARNSIIKQAPEYGEIMQGYEQATDALTDLRRTFTLPINERKAAQETALRKLQSVMRDKVNTNFGQRRKLAEMLSEDAPDLMYKLAGQSLNPLTAHGLGKLTMSMGAEALALFGGITGGAGLSGGLLGAGAAAALMSPRLMGNVAYRAGQAAQPFRYTPYIFQAGRADEGQP